MFVNLSKIFCAGILFLFSSILGSVNIGSAQTVNEYYHEDSLRAGDNFEFGITLSRTDDYDDIIFPDSSDFGNIFEIRDRQQFKVSTYKDSLVYQLQFFGTSDTLLPALPIFLVQGQDTTTLYTNPVPISFKSLLAENEEELRPFKPIFDFAAAWWPYIIGFLLLLIAAAALYYYYTQKEPEPSTEPEPVFQPTPFRDPLRELQSTLNKLDKRELATEDEFERFYIDLGDAIREYFESLYRIPALESTSGEIMQQLKIRAIDEDLVNDTREVLQEADMVKFAKFTPTTEQAQKALKKGHNFLKRAREVDGPRVDHMRRRHTEKMEAEKKKFYENHKTSAEVE